MFVPTMSLFPYDTFVEKQYSQNQTKASQWANQASLVFFFWKLFVGSTDGEAALSFFTLSLRYLVCELWWVCLALLDRWLFLVESTFSFFHDIYLLLLLLLSSFVFSACSFSQPHKTPLLFFFFFLFLCFSIYISKLKVSHFLPGKSLL